MVFIPIISAVAGAGSFIVSKFILSKGKISEFSFVKTAFLINTLILGIFLPIYFNYSTQWFNPIHILGLLIVVILGSIYNVLFYEGFKHEQLSESENLLLVYPLLLVILSSIFYPDERNLLIIIPTLIATSALVISHVNKHHLSFTKANRLMLTAIFLNAVEMLFIKNLLTVYSPLMLYFIRCFFIAGLLVIYLGFPKVSKSNLHNLSISQSLTILYVIFMYLSISLYGLVLTGLVLNLVPVLTYMYAVYFLKERVTYKKSVAMAITLCCVIFVQIIPLLSR